MYIQLDSGYFCATVKLENGIMVVVAPILKYMRGWREAGVRQYAAKKGWKLTALPL